MGATRGGHRGGAAAARGGRAAPAGAKARNAPPANRGPNTRYNNQRPYPQGNVAQAQPGAMPPLPTPQELAAQSPQETKNMLGDRLYHLIAKNHPDLSGKITGMLLESMDNTELILLLEDGAALDGKVNEALNVLRESGIPVEGTPEGGDAEGGEQ
ncbi:MAG TPA: hypothetical protein V6D20_07570 [Candidatus Obscuribacterales bacterium]